MPPRTSHVNKDGTAKAYIVSGGQIKAMPPKKNTGNISYAGNIGPRNRRPSAGASRQNQSTTGAGDAGIRQTSNITDRDVTSTPNSLFDGSISSSWAAAETPDENTASMEQFKLPDQKRREQRALEEQRRKQEQIEKERLASDRLARAQLVNEHEQSVHTHSQRARDAENKRKNPGESSQKRGPTAPMMGGSNESYASTPEAGEIVEGTQSSSMTFDRHGSIPPFGPIAPYAKVTSPLKAAGLSVDTGSAAKPQAEKPDPIIVDATTTAPVPSDKGKGRAIPASPQSISSDDSDSPMESDSGVPARVRDSPAARKDQSKFIKSPSPDAREASEETSAPVFQSDLPQQQISEPMSQKEWEKLTETQIRQVAELEAERDEADPDFITIDDDDEVAEKPPRHTRSSSNKEGDLDFMVLDQDPFATQTQTPTPMNVQKRPAKEPSPEAPSSKKRKARHVRYDQGRAFDKCTEKGKKERVLLLNRMRADWGCSVDAVVAEEIRPRPVEASSSAIPPKTPINWSTKLLNALAHLSHQTRGQPELAARVLKEAVKQQVAKFAGVPFLCEEDVKFAIQLLQDGFQIREDHPGSPLSPNGDLNARTREMSIQDSVGAGETPTRQPRSVISASRALQQDVDMITVSDDDGTLADVLQRQQTHQKTAVRESASNSLLHNQGAEMARKENSLEREVAIVLFKQARARLVELGIDPASL